MPNIFELWQEKKIGEGEYFKIPIQEKQFTLPQIFTGEKDQTVATINTIRNPNGSIPLTSCTCISTGKLHNHNSQLLLIGEVLPIPVTLTAYSGAINGSVAINAVCAALLSMPNQLIAARSINLEHIKKYKKKISNLGEYSDEAYWVDDYIALTGKPGASISCGLYYIYDKNQQCISGLCEIISRGTADGEKVESPIRFGETYTNFIRPVYYVDVRNPALEIEFENGAWVIKLQ